jgi:integrase
MLKTSVEIRHDKTISEPGHSEMGRPATHIITRDHPYPRFRDKIRLHQFRRNAQDDIWCATFLVGGQWQTRKPVSLGTRDFDEASEVARDKYAVLQTGQQITRAYKAPAPRKSQVEHPLRVYGERAIKKLREEAAAETVAGKEHNALAIARRIENDLVPRWGDTDITKLDEHALNDWIADEYRVEDTAATVARYGRQPKREGRQKVLKKPGVTTLGNLDWALRRVWSEAVADKIVDRRQRPMINKGLGEEGEARAFIDAAGVQAVARVMTDEWIACHENGDHPDHSPDMKWMLRTYVAIIACTGIRAGLEAKRVVIGNVQFLVQRGRPVILIRVVKHQGKHRDARSVIVYEGDRAFNIRKLLREHIAWRREQGATDRDYMFAWPDGSFPVFRDVFDTVLRQANALTDPMTGEKRVAYSFRHYFATRLIEQRLSVAQVAEWLGTSSAMVEKHYNRFLTERNAYLLNGSSLAMAVDPMPDPWRTPEDDALDEMADRDLPV